MAPVLALLAEWGLDCHCLDQSALWRDTGSFDPAERTIVVGGHQIADAGLIWYRRPHPVQVGRMAMGDVAFAQEEFRDFLFGALASFDTEWHSAPVAMIEASFKPTQLAWALRDGRMAVPRTLITSDKVAARSFLGARPEEFVIKSVTQPVIETEIGFDALFTTKVGPAILDHLDELQNSPCIFQEFVRRTGDVRLTLVGRKIFAVFLDSSDGGAAVEADHRNLFYTEMKYSPIDVPEFIASACVDMCRHFDLSYGAFDFAVDTAGRWWFLELNPFGQWAWVEEMTGMPIAGAFAALFAERIEANR